MRAEARRRISRIGGVLVALGLLGLLLWAGPSGSAWRANDAFAECITRAEPLLREGPDGGFHPAYVEAVMACQAHCETVEQPSWLESVGLFFQMRLPGNRDGPSCVVTPDLGSVIPATGSKIEGCDGRKPALW